MTQPERIALGAITGPGLNEKKVEIEKVVARGITNQGLYEVSPDYCGFLQDEFGNFLFFQWSPYFSRSCQGEEYARKREAETSRLVSILRTSSETNTPINVQGVILDGKKSELAPEEYYLQIIGVNLANYSTGDFISDVDIPLAKDMVKRIY